MTSTAVGRPPLAHLPVLSAIGAQVFVLTLLSGGYGYHRDELYFRMLPARWAYVDQPGFAPLGVRTVSAIVDEPWAIRIPATLCAAVSVYVVALLTREVGGSRPAQALSAWGYAFGVLPLMFGHFAVTPAFDLPVWPAIVLFAVRALLRGNPRWWLAVGVAVGLATYLKLLVAVLVASLVAGLLVAGPRRVLRSGWLWSGALAAALLAAPNLVYQWQNDLPQVAVGAGLAESHATAVRWAMWPFLLVLIGPPQTVVWVAGWRELWRRSHWRPLRGLAVALPVLLILTCAMGTQLYYPLGLIVALYAIGCVPIAERFARLPLSLGHARSGVAGWVAGWVAPNAVIAAVLALPVLPLSWLGVVPVTVVSPLAAESIGWPGYVAQVAAVRDALPAADRERSVVLTANYGEAGAVARYGSALGIDTVYSGHNALADAGPPPADRPVAVVVGPINASLFSSCVLAGSLSSGSHGGTEQDAPLQVCREPVGGWSAIWPRIRHVG